MRKCRVCRSEYEPRNSLQMICSAPCAIAFARRRDEARQKAREADERRRLREARERIKPLSQVCAETQRDVNRYVMALARAEGRVCISCDSPNITDAGHYIHAGSKYRTSRLRFALILLEPQCGHCNRYSGGGNHAGYTAGLLNRYGADRLQEIAELKRQADSGELAPLTKEECRQIAAEYRRMTREIERRASV